MSSHIDRRSLVNKRQIIWNKERGFFWLDFFWRDPFAKCQIYTPLKEVPSPQVSDLYSLQDGTQIIKSWNAAFPLNSLIWLENKYYQTKGSDKRRNLPFVGRALKERLYFSPQETWKGHWPERPPIHSTTSCLSGLSFLSTYTKPRKNVWRFNVSIPHIKSVEK